MKTKTHKDSPKKIVTKYATIHQLSAIHYQNQAHIVFLIDGASQSTSVQWVADENQK